MRRVVGSGHEAGVALDDNGPGVFARRGAGRDGVGGSAGGAGVGSVERVVDGGTRGGRDSSIVAGKWWMGNGEKREARVFGLSPEISSRVAPVRAKTPARWLSARSAF